MSLDCYAMDEMDIESTNNETEAQAPAAGDSDLPLISAEDWAQRKRLAKPAIMMRLLPLTAVFIACALPLAYITGKNLWFATLYIPLFAVWFYFIHRFYKPLCHRFNLLCPLCGAEFLLTGAVLSGLSTGNVEQGGECPKCKRKILDNDKRPLNENRLVVLIIVACMAAGLLARPVFYGIGYIVSYLLKFIAQWIPFLRDKDIFITVSMILGACLILLGIFLLHRMGLFKKLGNWLEK